MKREERKEFEESQIRREGVMGNKEWPPREEYDMRSSTMRQRENGVSRKI